MTIVYLLFKKRTRIFNYYTYWSIHIVFFVFIIVLKFQNLFKWLIDGVLQKWRSLELRMDLWDRTIKLIFDAPIFGHGIKTVLERQIENGFNFAMHAHNQLLETLYLGGVVNLVLLIIIIVTTGRRLYKHRNLRSSMIISIAFLGWCVATLVEPFTTSFLMGMFVLGYNSIPAADKNGPRLS